MPFIDYDTYAKAFPNRKGLVATAEAFEGINDAVSIFISDRAGIPIPDSRATAPAWTLNPALWLAFRFIAVQSSSPSAELASDSKNLYEQAVDIIDQHIEKRPITHAQSGTIAERFTW